MGVAVPRCMFCWKRIWLWQRRGWRTDGDGITDHWHSRCWQRYAEEALARLESTP